MTKLEEYTGKAAESLSAAETATTERDRAFHRRAHAVWRRLIQGQTDAAERAAAVVPAAKPTRVGARSTAAERRP